MIVNEMLHIIDYSLCLVLDIKAALQVFIVGCDTDWGRFAITFSLQTTLHGNTFPPSCRILDRVTGRSRATSDYVLSEPLKCPRCMAAIYEETLVEAG